MEKSLNTIAPISSEPSLVSIILPFFNRGRYLVDAIEAIGQQTYESWELIAIDDGSTDDSVARFQELTASMKQPVTLLRQENAGAYAARAHGLQHARGEFIGMYDSDDIWLAHHLKDCVDALNLNQDVEWVYGANRRIDVETGKTVSENTFYEGGAKRFLELATQARGDLRVIDDSRIVCYALRDGLSCGLHSSVIRRTVFERVPFRGDLRNGEDRLFAIRAAKRGVRFAYFNDVHQIYRIHATNSSAVGGKQLDHQLAVYRIITQGYADLFDELPLSQSERHTLHEFLATQYFWHIGYSLLWQNGRYLEALNSFRQGIGHDRSNWGMWKTYLLSRARVWLKGSVCHH